MKFYNNFYWNIKINYLFIMHPIILKIDSHDYLICNNVYIPNTKIHIYNIQLLYIQHKIYL